MKTIYAVIFFVMLLLVPACAPKVNDPADVAAIKQSVDDYVKGSNAGDADAVAALMTDKTVYASPNVPVAVGKEAIRSLIKAFNSQFKFDAKTSVEDVRVVGDLAVLRGTWTEKGTPKAQGIAAISDSGSFVLAFDRQSDGSWKRFLDISNSNQPLPGSTASGEDEKALLQIEQDMGEALLRKDAAAMDKILANEFQANYASIVGNKKQFLAAMKSDATKFESMTGSEMKALVFGDTAIVHGLSISKSSMLGKDTSGTERFTEVFVKREGRWQCVTGHSTKVQ